MRSTLAHWLMRLLRSAAGKRLLGRWIGWIFTYMSFALPLQRLRETPTLLAFKHPQPVYPLHILLVPKRSLPDFAALPPDDSALLHDLVQTVQSLVQEFQLEQRGYRLIVNGGPNQDLPQLHFHLISEQA